MREAVRANRGKQEQEVMMVKRDGSGRHSIGPVMANGTGAGIGAMKRARMQITPDRLLPDKPIITRSPSMESDSSSSCMSDRSGNRPKLNTTGRTQSVDNDCLTERTPEEEEPPHPPRPARQRTLSASFTMDSSAIDDLPEPEPNAELNQHMELLFEEYMRIERGAQSLRETPERETPSQPKQSQPGIKKDFTKVKSRLADYIKGKKDAPANNVPQRKNSATTPMGFRRPASASTASNPRRSSLATSMSQSKENILDGRNANRPTSRGSSPAMSRRALPATPKSMPASPTTPMPRPRSATGQRRESAGVARPTTPVSHQSRRMVRSQSVGRVQLHRREQSKSREDLLDEGSATRGRKPFTPNVNQGPRPGSAGSAFRPVTPKVQQQQQTNQDRSTGTPAARVRPKSAQGAFHKIQSRSREDLLDGASSRAPAITPAWRSKTPTPVSSGTSSFRAPSPKSVFKSSSTEKMNTTQELHNTIAEIADFVAKLPKDFDRPLDLDLPEKDKSSPTVAAKPRKDKLAKEGPKTKIPMPVSQRDRDQESGAFSPTLKRFDSGVDINITDSPTESSIHDEDEQLPWHQENGLQYSSSCAQEQEYF